MHSELSKKCEHIYKNIYQDICPKCGKYTHETDFAYQRELHAKWIKDGKHLEMQCPLGGTIRGWWDI